MTTKARLKQRLADARAYEQVFASPEGSRVLYDLLRAGGVLQTSLVPGDPYMSAFNEGRRSLALHIIDQLRWNEAELAKLAMMQSDEEMRLMEVN